MRMIKVIFSLFLFLLTFYSGHAAVRFAAGGLSMGLSLGYSPDLFYLSEKSEGLANQNINILNKMNKINKLYDSTAYGETQVIRDFKYNSNAVGSIPVEVSLKYSWYGIMFRVGFTYFNAPVDSKSYVITTGSATTRNYPSTTGSATLYSDLQNNYDTDPGNNESLAYGLRPTYGQAVRMNQYLKLSRFEIPVTFGISMFDLGPASFFFGGGFTFYYASKTRVIQAEGVDRPLDNPEFFVDDVDKFSASSIGFHIMLGGEYRFVKDVGITMDLTLNFGSTGPTTDSVRTGAFTNNSLFHSNDGKDYGGNEKPDEATTEETTAGADNVPFGSGLERTDSFDFQGMRIMIGFNYHIARNKTSSTILGKDKGEKK